MSLRITVLRVEGVQFMMTRTARIGCSVVWLGFLAAAGSLPATDPKTLPSEWSFDRLKLKNGYELKGLVLEETPNAVRFQHVYRLPGRPTICFTSLFYRSEIEMLNKIGDAERELLQSRLKEIDPSGEGESRRMESLELKEIEWNGKAKGAFRYDSDHFSLISAAPDDIVRRSAVRLEQIYAAYANFLPPRHPGGKPTTIVLYPVLEDYEKMLSDQGWKLENPAFFDPRLNRVVCGSNLVKLGKDLEEVREQHRQQRAALDRREVLVRQLYGKKPMELARHLQPILENRQAMAKADRHNDRIFDSETRRVFRILYHEAFHAYATNFVYPESPNGIGGNGLAGELPRWLNEGLAQVFESAIVEAGELRIDYPARDRLERAQEAVIRGELMPLKELLVSNKKQFLVLHRGDRAESDRVYLSAWAVSLYLLFEARVIGSTAFDDFVRAVNRGSDPIAAFEKLTGQPLAETEKALAAWLKRLAHDKSLLAEIRKDR